MTTSDEDPIDVVVSPDQMLALATARAIGEIALFLDLTATHERVSGCTNEFLGALHAHQQLERKRKASAPSAEFEFSIFDRDYGRVAGSVRLTKPPEVGSRMDYGGERYFVLQTSFDKTRKRGRISVSREA